MSLLNPPGQMSFSPTGQPFPNTLLPSTYDRHIFFLPANARDVFGSNAEPGGHKTGRLIRDGELLGRGGRGWEGIRTGLQTPPVSGSGLPRKNSLLGPFQIFFMDFWRVIVTGSRGAYKHSIVSLSPLAPSPPKETTVFKYRKAGGLSFSGHNGDGWDSAS